MTYLTQEQFETLQKFADDDRSPITMEILTAFANLNAKVEANILKHLTGARKRNTMLEERMERMKEKKTERIEAGQFEDTGLDSVDVAKGLLYHLQKLNTYRLNKYKLQAILYEMYASWLYSKHERLFQEQPVATEFGPRFWRVFKRVETTVPVAHDEWKSLCESNPGVAKFCENAARKYYDYTEGDLSRMFISSKPYKNADKDHNDGKWNKEISDKDIYEWKSKQKNP